MQRFRKRWPAGSEGHVWIAHGNDGFTKEEGKSTIYKMIKLN
jgi:hypothetical protein